MLTFVVAALVLIMMPGPDQTLITRNALAGGRRGGLLTMVGGVLGLTIHASLAAAGLSVLLLTSVTAFVVMKAVGAVYLLWLGAQTLWATRPSSLSRSSATARGDVPPNETSFLRQGFLSNALNPKVALFFVTFVPQFLPSDTPVPWVRASLLSLVFAGLYLAWFSLYVMLVQRLSRFLHRLAVRMWIERITGCLLVGMAIRLALATQ